MAVLSVFKCVLFDLQVKWGEDGLREMGETSPRLALEKKNAELRERVFQIQKRVKTLLMNKNIHPCTRIVPASTLSIIVNIHCFIDLFILVLNIGCILTVYIIGHG